MIRRTLATLTDADVKHRRTITLGTLTGRLRAVWSMGNGVALELDCGDGLYVTTNLRPRETACEVRA
jgi:hypothetical protein